MPLGLSEPSIHAHPNATPARLAWIAREAPTMDNPAGWARRCIEAAWNPPAPTGADAAAASAAKWDAIRERFNALHADERGALVAKARARFTNLSNPELYPTECDAILGAVAKLEGWTPARASDPRGPAKRR